MSFLIINNRNKVTKRCIYLVMLIQLLLISFTIRMSTVNSFNPGWVTSIATNYKVQYSCSSRLASMDSRDNKVLSIEDQKERAKKFWNEANYDEEMKRKVHGNVMKHLNEGTVLPIFHTLCQPPDKRLFSPNTILGNMDFNCTDVIHLSSENVTAGKCADESDNVIHKVSKDLEMSYMPAFSASMIIMQISTLRKLISPGNSTKNIPSISQNL